MGIPRECSCYRCAGENPDFATQDLFEAIQNQTYPGWTLYAQVLTPQQAETFKCVWQSTSVR